MVLSLSVKKMLKDTSTHCTPKHLIVQAAQEVYDSHPAGDWRRANIKGNVPIILRISEWALAPSNQDDNGHRHFFGILSGILSMSCRVFLVSIPLMILLSLPIEKAWMDLDFQKACTEVPYYCWDYPKYARNSLDMQPSPEKQGNRPLFVEIDKRRPQNSAYCDHANSWCSRTVAGH